MLVSFLLPTRKRVVKLARAINSIHATAVNKSNYEICLRVHQDDHETIAMLPNLLALGNVRVHIGTYLDWAHNVNAFDDACRIANGSWVWWFNDDCVLEGSGWDTQLWELQEQTIAIPEIHRLGKSTYLQDRHVPMFAMPIYSWGSHNFPCNGDTGLWDFYERNKWNVHWLRGITLWHDRDEQDCNRIKSAP